MPTDISSLLKSTYSQVVFENNSVARFQTLVRSRQTANELENEGDLPGRSVCLQQLDSRKPAYPSPL